jgi:hypothetical protein
VTYIIVILAVIMETALDLISALVKQGGPDQTVPLMLMNVNKEHPVAHRDVTT